MDEEQGSANAVTIEPTAAAAPQEAEAKDGILERIGNTIGNTISDFGHGVAQEGMSGLLDPSGMMDRQQAQHELRDRFDIVPDGTADLKGNQVTEAEFEKRAKLYSDIRLDRTDIKFDHVETKGADGQLHDTSADYKAGVMNDMADMLQTQSGNRVLAKLADNTTGVDPATGKPLVDAKGEPIGDVDPVTGAPVHHTTTLHPMLDKDGNLDPTQAESSPADRDGRKQEVGYGCTNQKGQNVSVGFNPGQTVNVPGPEDGNWDPSVRSDVVLMHELTHAYYDTSGRRAIGDVERGEATGQGERRERYNDDDADAGVKQAEHQAVGIGAYDGSPVSENAYRRERNEIAGRPGARPFDGQLPQRERYR